MTLNLELDSQEKQNINQLKLIISESSDEVTKREVATWDDELLLAFIRCRNNDIQSAFKRIQQCVISVSTNPKSILRDVYPERLSVALNAPILEVLKNRDCNGCRVLIFRYCNWNLEIVSIDEAVQTIFLIAIELLFTEKETQENGVTFVWDIADMNLRQTKQLTPSFLKRYCGIFSKGVPIKLSSIHVLNAPKLFNMTMDILRYFMPQKLRNRIYAHGSSYESLHKQISPEILPDYYEGNLAKNEALDYSFIPALMTKERNDYYKALFSK